MLDWLQQNNHPIELDTNEMMDQRLNYIHNNPLEAGLVDDPSSWIWSSCASYEKDIEGKLPLVYIVELSRSSSKKGS